MNPALSPELIKAYSNAGVAGLLALALIVVVSIAMFAAIKMARSQGQAHKILQEHHSGEMRLWQTAIESLQSGQKEIAGAMRCHTDAIKDLTRSVGTEALNQIRLGAGSQVVEAMRKIDRVSGVMDRLGRRLDNFEVRISTLEGKV